jgi:hypothetical protein
VVRFKPLPLYARGNSPPYPSDRWLGEPHSRSCKEHKAIWAALMVYCIYLFIYVLTLQPKKRMSTNKNNKNKRQKAIIITTYSMEPNTS